MEHVEVMGIELVGFSFSPKRQLHPCLYPYAIMVLTVANAFLGVMRLVIHAITEVQSVQSC